MANKMMCLPYDHAHNINYPICKLKLVVKRLNTQLNEPTNQNSLLSPNLCSKHINTSSDI